MVEGRMLHLGEVASTQDAALEYALQPGDACYSFLQSAGRGRRGNAWVATGGVAVTVVLETATMHLPIAIAATLAAQLNDLIPEHYIGIKWPNDLYVNGKKLAGVLMEQRENVCLVGVGVNILTAPIPTAASLCQLGFEGTKEAVATSIVRSIFDATQLDENAAVTQWRKRDMLIGKTQIIKSGDNTVEGVVLSIDPCHNLLLETPSGILALPAATSTAINPCK